MTQVLYDRIGIGYNNTRQADPFLAGRLFHLLEADPSKKYLDIGCGTGNYTIALAEKGVTITGVEPSAVMREQANARQSNVSFVTGSSENIPFADQYFDGVSAILTIHHWSSLAKGLKEIYRVLKTGGVLVIFHSTPKQMEGYWLNHYFPDFIPPAGSIMQTKEEIEELALDAGLKLAAIENYSVTPDLKDLFLQCGKHNPELYFRDDIRNGISTFRNFGTKEKLLLGLEMLRSDIDNVKFQKIKESYDNEDGDYLWLKFIAE